MNKLLSAGIALALAAGSAVAQPAPPPAAPSAAQPSGANLNISPKRVTLDRNRRTGAVYVFNQGNAAGTFDISLVDRVMLPDGRILAVADAQGDPAAKAVADRVKSAQPILQLSPRRITLGPGQGQTVRLRIAGAPDDPAAIELRTHLTISSLPPRESGVTADEAAAAGANPSELRFQINALLGLSIPAIVRLADPDVRAGLENAKVASGPAPALSVEVTRLGASSLFGNLEVRVAGQPRTAAPLGVARGVGVYTEIDRRAIAIPLSRAPAAGERLEVTFTDDDTSPGKLLAKLDF